MSDDNKKPLSEEEKLLREKARQLLKKIKRPHTAPMMRVE